MPTPKQTLSRLRQICASLDGVTEGEHHGAIAFKNRGKLFATFRERADDCEVVFGLEREELELLFASDPRFTRYPNAPAAVVHGSDIADWKQLAGYLRESHALSQPRPNTKAKSSKPATARAGSRRSRA